MHVYLQVIFDYPYEILTHITGSYGPAMYMGPNVIKSLTFHTTKRKHGPFGDEQGNAFTTKLKEGKIVGFHGRKGLFLDALGVHAIEGKVVPPVKPPPSNPTVPVPPPKAIVPVPSTDQRPAISEMDHPQWPNKLVMAKRGPVEEVNSKDKILLFSSYGNFRSYPNSDCIVNFILHVSATLET